MLHLFKEVYLAFDNGTESKYSKVIISHNCPAGDTNVLFASNSVDDIIGPSKKFPRFLDFVKELASLSIPVIVYADKLAYIKIVAAWTSLIFKTNSSDAAFSFTQCHLAKLINIGNSKKHLTSNVDSSSIINISGIEFNEVYSKIIPDDSDEANELVSSLHGDLSIELLVANYYASGLGTTALKKRLRLIELVDIHQFFQEIIEEIINNAFRSNFCKVAGLRSYETHTLIDIPTDPVITELKLIALLIDLRIKNCSSSWGGLADTHVDLITAQLNGIVFELYGVSDAVSIRRIALLKVLNATELSDAGLKAILDFELSITSSFFFPKNHASNTYFIDSILEPIRTAKKLGVIPDLSSLQRFIIKGN